MPNAISHAMTAWVTLAALLMYIWVVFNVGRARVRCNIHAPLMDGPQAFRSVLRVQANTVEQMVLFLPALWLCAVFYSDRVAAIAGAFWVVGRILYAIGYYRDPSKRGPGFGIGVAATLCLIGGTVVGLLGL